MAGPLTTSASSSSSTSRRWPSCRHQAASQDCRRSPAESMRNERWSGGSNSSPSWISAAQEMAPSQSASALATSSKPWLVSSVA